jgi:hypothetical protein
VILKCRDQPVPLLAKPVTGERASVAKKFPPQSLATQYVHVSVVCGSLMDVIGCPIVLTCTLRVLIA